MDDAVLDLRRIRVLRELCRRGTVSAAAAALHLTPSAVSQQLAGLARDLGVPLLEKQGRGVRLTGQARILLEHAARATEQMDRARADLVAWQDGTIGQVRVGAISTAIAAFVAPALPRLRSSRPGIDVRVSESEPPDSFELLLDGELDVVVAVDYRDAPSRTDRRFHRIELFVDRLDAVLPVGHHLLDDEALTTGMRLSRLDSEPWVDSAGDDPCSQITMAICAAAGFSPDVRHTCQDWDAVGALVESGAGIALVPSLARPLRQTGLVTCPIIDSPASRLIIGVIRAGDHHAPPAAAVLEMLATVAAERTSATT